MRQFMTLLCAVAVMTQPVSAAEHSVYRYRIGTAMSARAGFGPANAAFDKANAGGNSGLTAATYDGNGIDGTVAVDVVQRSSDGNGVFNVSQDGKPPVPCATGGDAGNVICETDARLRNETLMLLRVMMPVTQGHQDANRWNTASAGSDFTETAQFEIQHRDAQTLTVHMYRTTSQSSPAMTVTVDATLTYDAQTNALQQMHGLVTFTSGAGLQAQAAQEHVDFERITG